LSRRQFPPGGQGISSKSIELGSDKQIVRSFDALNPYQRDIIPGSVLKIEEDNYDQNRKTTPNILLRNFSKRCALFLWPRGRKAALLREKVNNTKDRWSRHGLGHLLNPTDPEASDRIWAAAVSETILRKGCGFRTTGLKFAHLPAVGRSADFHVLSPRDFHDHSPTPGFCFLSF
jgi:hypothetical protein